MERSRVILAREQVLDVPVLVGRYVVVNLNLTLLIGRDRLAVFIQNTMARLGSDAFARRDDASQVQRVGGADHNQLFIVLLFAHIAHQADRFGQCKMFTGKTLHETPAPDFTPRFEPAKHVEQITPRG